MLTYRTAAKKWEIKENLGNHRIIVSVPKGDYVCVTLPWRRRDKGIDNVGVIVRYNPSGEAGEEAVASAELKNVHILKADSMECELLMQCPCEGEYEVYYMPCDYSMETWWSPTVTYYQRKDMKPDKEWLLGYNAALADGRVAKGKAIAYESRTEFDSFYPMEIPMSQEETTTFFGKAGADLPFTVVAESRLSSVRMKYNLPLMWLDRSIEERKTLTDTVAQNEHYAFQLAVCAKEALEDVKVRFLDEKGNEYSIDQCICFNLNGKNVTGEDFEIQRNVAAYEVLPLWCGVRSELFVGDHIQIFAEIFASNVSYKEQINVTLKRTSEMLERNGDDDLWRMSRLFWLNSDIGIRNEHTLPYTPVCFNEEDNTIDILGRKMKFGKFGLPEKIETFYDEFCQLSDDVEPITLTNGNIELWAEEDGKKAEFANESFDFMLKGTSQATVKSTCESELLEVNSEIDYEFDGNVDCKIKLIPKKDGIYSFKLHIPLNKNAVQYMVGLGHEGGLLPAQWDYVWHPKRLGNMVWLGGTRAGIYLKLMPEDELWLTSHNPMPRLWVNDGLGGVRVKKNESLGTVCLDAWTGELKLEKGKSNTLHFHLIITPFHPISYNQHWTERYYHPGFDPGDNSNMTSEELENQYGLTAVRKAKADGATIYNLHQGLPLNAYINYPFFMADGIKEQVDFAHSLDMKYKPYYTSREQTVYTTEFWALRALGDEIFSVGKAEIADFFVEENRKQKNIATGSSWLIEHVDGGYSPAWHQFLQGGEFDYSIATCPQSRWLNYYLKGLDWLTRVLGMDGLYLDGIGYDRHVTRRARRILDDAKSGCRIDIHCGNAHDSESGSFGMPVCTYLEHIAYGDSLWFGEGFRYERQDPAYFLTESSGITLGLMGEMLQGGGNPYRGMVYGMTARAAWMQGGLCTPIWKLWDEFEMTRTKMYGYWNPECPVNVENDQVKATTYVRDDGQVLVALASWCPEERGYVISVNKDFLNIKGDYEFYAPAIEGFQEEATFASWELVPIEAGKGWIFIIRQ